MSCASKSDFDAKMASEKGVSLGYLIRNWISKDFIASLH